MLSLQIKDGEGDKLDKFFAVNSYVKGSYTDDDAFKGLNEALLKQEKGCKTGNRLFYLALPPSVFEPVTTLIKKYCMSTT